MGCCAHEFSGNFRVIWCVRALCRVIEFVCYSLFVARKIERENNRGTHSYPLVGEFSPEQFARYTHFPFDNFFFVYPHRVHTLDARNPQGARKEEKFRCSSSPSRTVKQIVPLRRRKSHAALSSRTELYSISIPQDTRARASFRVYKEKGSSRR